MMTKIPSITSRVIIQGRYLVHQDTRKRFFMRGIAFPTPPISRTDARSSYHPEGWIAVLQQLREASPQLNTIRLYQLDVDLHDYSTFIEQARLLGFYILVPLTSPTGEGVLNRDLEAPECYNPGLYNFGRRVLDLTWLRFVNVIGGILGNEVMNSLHSWPAAPCLLAYARDLKLHYREALENDIHNDANGNGNDTETIANNDTDTHADVPRDVPLIYTMQHDGMGAAISPGMAVQLTLEYMANCGSLDILGINIESWCSSLQSFEWNEDGSIGSYLDLHNHVVNASAAIPLIFSEIGCSRDLFNRDNGLERFSRDWKQLHVVKTNMSDVLSGFIAYAYDGPASFRMTQGGPWDGLQPLPFAKDMDNFVEQLQTLDDDVSSIADNLSAQTWIQPSKNCNSIRSFLTEKCDLNLLDIEDIPSYYVPNETPFNQTVLDATNSAAATHDNALNANNPGVLPGGAGVFRHNLMSRLIHLFSWHTIIFSILILATVLVPFVRRKLSAWRDTACLQRSVMTATATSTILTSSNGNHNGTSSNSEEMTGSDNVDRLNYDTFP